MTVMLSLLFLINALNSSSAEIITTLNEEIANLNNQLSKEKSTVSYLHQEKKKLKLDFKTREDELLDKQIQFENKIKELDNILVKTEVFVSQKAKSHEELYFSNTFKMASVSKSFSILNEELLDDTSTSVARKFLNEFLKEAAKFVRNFKSLTKEVDESLAKHKALEYEIERLLKAVVSQDIMSIVKSNSVADTSNLQTELDHTKEKLETCIIKKEKEYVVLWNNWINPFQPSREDKFVPINKVSASVRKNPITILQPHVITKKYVNSDSNGLSSTGVDNTAKTRRRQPRSNTKNDSVPTASKSSCIKNKEVKVEEHHRNLLLSKNKKYMLSEHNNIKLAIQNEKSKVVCTMCKQCLITSNHDVCVLNYVNDMNSRVNILYANVSNTPNKKKHQPKVKKPKMVGSIERLDSPKPSKPIYILIFFSSDGMLTFII
ncbi:hypothetical protein Tco_0026706 [Tanacetum coccineum]